MLKGRLKGFRRPAEGKMTLSVKYEDLNAHITEVRYHRVEGTTSTVCTVILHSGFVVVGHSAALNSEAFVAETGRELAYQDALQNLLALEAYRIKENAHDAQQKES